MIVIFGFDDMYEDICVIVVDKWIVLIMFFFYKLFRLDGYFDFILGF